MYSSSTGETKKLYFYAFLLPYLLAKLNLSKYVTLIIDVTRSMLLKLLGIIKIR